jgi:hypothetical protein
MELESSRRKNVNSHREFRIVRIKSLGLEVLHPPRSCLTPVSRLRKGLPLVAPVLVVLVVLPE